MIFKSYYLGCLAHASYLIGDQVSRLGIVVDPQRDIDQYLADAKGCQLEIRLVFLTHFHADFLAGHLELRDRTGARICLGSRAKADYEFKSLRDGEILEFGRLRSKIMETPGLSPESISSSSSKRSLSDHFSLAGSGGAFDRSLRWIGSW